MGKVPAVTVSGIPVPAEAGSEGGVNASIPMSQRVPEGAPLSSGPQKEVVPGSVSDTYFKPASYPTSRGNVRSDR